MDNKSLLSQPSSVVFACKTATFGPAFKSLWVTDLTCRLFSSKTAPFRPELQVSMGHSGANHAILHAQKDRWGVGPIETCISGPKVAVLHSKTKREGWDPWRLVILMLSTLFWKQKITGEVWDPQSLLILVLKSLFCMQKPQMMSGTHRDY